MSGSNIISSFQTIDDKKENFRNFSSFSAVYNIWRNTYSKFNRMLANLFYERDSRFLYMAMAGYWRDLLAKI